MQRQETKLQRSEDKARMGSLIDVIYKKGKGGTYEKRPALSAARILEIFEQVVAAVAHMHAQSPPVRAATQLPPPPPPSASHFLHNCPRSLR